MKKVFIVTGSTGFLGNTIVKKLSKNKDYEVRALVYSKKEEDILKDIDCKIFHGDITNKASLKDIFTVEDNTDIYVIHCAAIVTIKSDEDPKVYDVNVNGTNNVIDYCIEVNAKLLYVSSVHAIKESEGKIFETKDFDKDSVHGYYAKTKAEAAKNVLEAVKNRNLKACVFHPAGIIGPGDSSNTHTTQLVKRMLENKLVFVVNGGYNFVDVRDVADGIINAADMGEVGETYILSGEYISIKDYAKLVEKILGKKKYIFSIPIWFVKMIAPAMEKYYDLVKKVPLFTRYSIYTLQTNSNFSNDKAHKELNFRNRKIEDSIKDTIIDITKKEIQ